jgi:hypothetical protein
MIASAGDANRLDEPLFTQVPEVAGTWICWTIVMIAEVTTGDHSKRAEGRQRTRLRAAQCVLTLALAHDLSLNAARQVEVARERPTRIERAVRRLAIPFRPTYLIARIGSVPIGVRLWRVAWSAAEFSRVVITIPCASVRWSQIVVEMVARAALASARIEAPLVALVVVARIEIHTHLPVTTDDLSPVCHHNARPLGLMLGDKLVTIVRGLGWAAVAAHRQNDQ